MNIEGTQFSPLQFISVHYVIETVLMIRQILRLREAFSSVLLNHGIIIMVHCIYIVFLFLLSKAPSHLLFDFTVSHQRALNLVFGTEVTRDPEDTS